ncbi:MAG: aspartyl/asparaginyl beta-hydroxylase domain-containing protein [Gammaproteobacteria bacterium]|nr:aspartyl/asparaginyl beta-hydroxylase domain-containing protein [Gammaproteobacteria bacterium]
MISEKLRQGRRRWIKKTGRRVLHITDRFIARQSLIGDSPVFNKSVFPWTADFETNWESIRKELDEVLKDTDSLPSFHDISPDQKRISKGDNWKTFIFYGLGHRVDGNCERCPETVKMLERCADLQNAWFSILKPGYRIPPHKGPTNGIVRIHLGLIIPEQRDQCWIRVHDQILHWEEGKCIVFDDSYEHEVQNNTDQRRVVLFFDVIRPMRTPGRLLNRVALALLKKTAYFRDARKNMEQWESTRRRVS